MFEFDAGKLIIIGIVALIVIGPKELPRVMRQVGHVVAKLRRMGTEFQAQFMEAMREADAEEITAQARELVESAKVDLNPLALVKAELTSALEQPARAPEAAPSSTAPLNHAEPPVAPSEPTVPAATAARQA
ncbi:MAG: Sec-independent protein translocase subunit TatA/TatB [Methylovirgula sp.]